MIEVKSQREITIMREAGRMTAIVLAELAALVRPGLSADILDLEAKARIERFAGAAPAFRGYRGFPGNLCVSINAEVVHGIPKKNKVIREGDLVSLDLGVLYQGYYGDAATTVAVGAISDSARRLIEATRTSLSLGLAQVKPGATTGDLGHAIESHVKSLRMSVVREFVGHGIGRRLHEEPSVPNFGEPGRGARLVPGMTIAVEPMVALGSGDVVIGPDGWTAKTKDASWAAHFEHTVLVTQEGFEILTYGEHE
ncbi:MAG: type I methionyl aminopeptidase [Elusimicrobia bacterium]|nr:type I methionyl aminopeptidase [Elusimicrobiota bacterium]